MSKRELMSKGERQERQECERATMAALFFSANGSFRPKSRHYSCWRSRPTTASPEKCLRTPASHIASVIAGDAGTR